MKNNIKQEYIPCRLDVVKFKVERGFALTDGFMETEIVNQQGVTTVLWSMSCDANNNFKNLESYQDQQLIW